MTLFEGKEPETIVKPLTMEEMDDYMYEWEQKEFFENLLKDGNSKLYEVMFAANYMEITSVVNMVCTLFARMLIGHNQNEYEQIILGKKD